MILSAKNGDNATQLFSQLYSFFERVGLPVNIGIIKQEGLAFQ